MGGNMVGFLRRSLRWVVLAGVVAVLAVAPAKSAKGDITYAAETDGVMAENTDILNIAVSITTDGDTGPIVGGDVLSWKWTVTDTTTHTTASSSSATPQAFLQYLGTLDATAQSLSLANNGDGLRIGDGPVGSQESVLWLNSGGNLSFQGQIVSEQKVTLWNVSATNPFATFTPGGTVPEPSTLALFAGFGALSMLIGWRKQRRVTEKPVE
jgi:hypothetical protein